MVGGYAVAFHGYPRTTQDLDIWVATSKRSAERLIRVLHEFGFVDPELSAEVFLDPDRLVRLGVPPMRLELLTSVSGLTFHDVHARASRTAIDGVPITVIGLEDLRTNKRAAGRPRDLADLEELPES